MPALRLPRRTAPPIALALSLLVLTQALGAPPRLGQPITPPANAQRVERTYGFLVDFPIARISEPGEFELTFETAEPTPPAIVYLGINTLDEELDYPRYRTDEEEDGDFDDLRTEHKLRIDFRSLLRRLRNTAYDARVCWRAEVFLPSKQSSRFVEGRVNFDPDTLGDATTITYGPIVDQVGESSAVISWETDRDSNGTVLIFLQDARADTPPIAEARSESTGRKHELRIDHLRPRTRYAYTVQSGTTTSRRYGFTTAGGDRFAFAAMVDSREGYGGALSNFGGVNAMSLRLLGQHAYHSEIDFILFGGDLVDGYTTSTADFRLQLHAWRQALAPVAARVPIYESMGNHEALIDMFRVGRNRLSADKPGDESAEAVFADMFVNPRNGPDNEGEGSPTYQENVYRLDHGNARFFVLNNNYWWCSNPHLYGGNLEGFIMPAQIAWLRKEVMAADADPTVAHLFYVAQEPPFPNGGHTKDSMWYGGGDTDEDGDIDADDIPIVQCRNELWSIIASSSKSVAFIAGDEHSYNRLAIKPETPVGHKRLPDGSEAVFPHAVWQVTAGGSGAPWYDKQLDLPWSGGLRVHSTQPHYARFEVDGSTVRLTAYSQTGQLLDELVLKRNGENAID